MHSEDIGVTKVVLQVSLPLNSWPELVWFPGPGASLLQYRCLGINYQACTDTAPADTWTYKHGKLKYPAWLGDNNTLQLVWQDTHSELGALARQVGEQVGGGRQTGRWHVGVGRVRQLMKAPNSVQTASSIWASEEANQKMHAILLPTGRMFYYTDNTRETEIWMSIM